MKKLILTIGFLFWTIPLFGQGQNFPSGGGGAVNCTTTGGLAYENGTNNTLTCGAGITSNGSEMLFNGGDLRFTGNATLDDSTGVAGNNSQLLSSTGTGLKWVAGTPATKGIYNLIYNLPTDAVVTPTAALVGIVPDAAAGATFLFGDCYNPVYNPAAALSLPTATTLENANCGTSIINNGAASTITPVTWTISKNGGTPGATAVVTPHTKGSLLTQIAATQWNLDTSDEEGYINGLIVPTSATGLATNSSAQLVQQTSANILAICTTCDTSASANTSNVYAKGAGLQALQNSLTTDDGTTSTYTGTGGTKSPVFTSTGTTAGFVDYPQGTTSAAVAPCNVATSICEQAPTSVTSYLVTKPGAAPTVAGSYAATSTAGVQSWASSNGQFCGTTTSCSATAEPNMKIVFGSAALVSGTPSTAAVTGISPAFTATGDYVCTVSGQSGAATDLLSVVNVSASAFTITGPATDTRVVNYICVGF